MGKTRYERNGENEGAVYSFKVVYDDKEILKEGMVRRAVERLYEKLGLEFRKRRSEQGRRDIIDVDDDKGGIIE